MPDINPSGWSPPDINLSRRAIGLIVGAALVGITLLTMVFQIPADSIGVVMRFGEPVRDVGPGLHVKAPIGIEEVRVVPTQRQRKVEFGYRTETAGVDSKYKRQGYEHESLMLTGDLNVVDVQWAVQYRIEDARNYLFEVRDVRETFRYMSQAVMREVVGDRTVSEVLTVGRAEVADTVKKNLSKLCDDYDIGLRVEQVNLQDITPPDPVKPSFNEVNEAQQEKSEMINQAKAAYNKAIPAAKGTAKRKIEQAEGYAVQRVNRAKGEAARFNSLYESYRKAPEVTRRRIYIETISEVLPKIDRKIVIDEGSGGAVPLLPLGDMSQLPAPGSKTDSNSKGGSQ
jgi:membrane protease subunit HflK